jgi:flagellum-specific ATP synthase
LNATYAQHRDLITIGAYAKGSDPRVDEAIQHWPAILRFLQQDSRTQIPFAQSVQALQDVFAGAREGVR